MGSRGTLPQVSDCGAVENIATAFHYNKTLPAAAATAVAAGCDIDCGSSYSDGAADSWRLFCQCYPQPQPPLNSGACPFVQRTIGNVMCEGAFFQRSAAPSNHPALTGRSPSVGALATALQQR